MQTTRIDANLRVVHSLAVIIRSVANNLLVISIRLSLFHLSNIYHFNLSNLSMNLLYAIKDFILSICTYLQDCEIEVKTIGN